jgi:antitoxin component YwqK of YwqJK toxin-antitoxin module
MVLHAQLVMKTVDDWWLARLATYAQQGKDQKHGTWTAWYPNSQMKFTGEYQLDKPHGKFSWWHQNGQKSLEAHYLDGQKDGQWTWWHPNGQKSIQGQYTGNVPVDQWTWWHDTGKVAQRIDFSTPASTVVSRRTGHVRP